MARIRTIQPSFAGSPSMGRVSRDARLLFVLLWTIVDDEGRSRNDPGDLAHTLFPRDNDAPADLPRWLGELEAEGCIERYAVDGVEYLRVVHWRRHQQIDHPTESRLPPSPHESPWDSRIREGSRKRCGQPGKMQLRQALAGGSDTIRENHEEKVEDPIVVTRQSLLRDIQRIQTKSEGDGSYSNALKSVAMKAQFGLPAGKQAGKIGKEPAPSDVGPPIDELFTDEQKGIVR